MDATNKELNQMDTGTVKDGTTKKEDDDDTSLKYEESDEGGGSEAAAERRRRRKAKSKYSSLMENDDLEKMLKWKNGIGYLPDSNLKFRKSDIGALEVVSPSSEDEEENDVEAEVQFNETNKFKRQQRRGTRSKQELKSPSLDTPTSTPPPTGGKNTEASEKRIRRDRKKKKFSEDEFLKCETCGCYGIISEFCSSGRFCSQRCVGAYASKKRAEMIQTQLDNGERNITPNKKQGGTGKKKKDKDHSPSSPTVHKNKKNIWKEPVSDDSTVYYKTVGFETGFCWDTYIQITGARRSPIDAFYKEYDEQEILPNPHNILSGMKLECIDPKHQSLFCCCTVIEVQGGRLRLNFDGWPPSYDFWVNANSFFLHPCGWCDRNGQKLQPPKGMDAETFNWAEYLNKTNSMVVPDHLFYEPPPVSRHGFRTCMKLEAVDRKNPDLVCVASINNTMGDQFLIHFDEWDDLYDYWCRHDNPYIHPMGWCQDNGITLVPPTDEMVGRFIWGDYLNETNTIAAPQHFFQKPQNILFKPGDKLEVIDPRNPSLCRVGTVKQVEEFKLLIHFDGWQAIYDYWFDFDSTDLHPVGWCAKTGHALEPPPTNRDSKIACGIPGCRGIGHIKGAKYTTHHTSFGCPYTAQNINRSTSPVIDRLAVDSVDAEGGKVKPTSTPPAEEMFPDSTTSNIKSYSGKPKKQKGVKTTIRKRKRRRSDEVSSSTNIEERTPHEYNPMEPPKKIRPTHVPAGRHPNNGCQVLNKSRAIPWGMTDVSDFLVHLGYEDLVPAFNEHQIDGQALLLLSQADLVHHLKLKLGPALKIYSEISKL